MGYCKKSVFTLIIAAPRTRIYTKSRLRSAAICFPLDFLQDLGLCLIKRWGINMLEKEYEYFQKNKKELKEKFLGKFIVIKNEEVIGAYSSAAEALKETSKKYAVGSFLIQQVVENDADYIQRFHSRVFV